MEKIIELKDICFQYSNSNKGLSNLSIDIPRKKKTVILGLNGAGKSTLFLTLCGILKPISGTYLLDGKLFRFTKKERNTIGQKIGYIFQDPDNQLFAPTVYEDIAFGLHNMNIPSKEVRKRVVDCLDFLHIMHLKDTAPHELSYGQKKLVAIAGVLVMKPQILILDEPFAWLDNVQEKNMKQILNELHTQGITIILSTHRMDFAFSWSDYTIVMQEGTNSIQGTTSELLKQTEKLQKIGLDI